MRVENVYTCDKCGEEFRTKFDRGADNFLIASVNGYETKSCDLCDKCMRYYKDVYLNAIWKYRKYAQEIEKNAMEWLGGNNDNK